MALSDACWSVLAVAVTASGCGGGNSGAPSVVSTPTEHRANPMACPASPSPPPCQGGGSCKTNADCTAGQNGRCIGGGIVFCTCAYDQCNVDSDCAAGQDCACHVTYRDATGAGPNTCVSANCKSDADCASGFCSPSYKADYCQSYVDGYYCHTAQDECAVDSDCAANGIGYAVCAFQPQLGHWGCTAGPFCAG